MARPKKAQAGERISFSTSLTARAKGRLGALAHLTGKNVYDLLEEAFWVYWDALPENDRTAGETIAKAVEDREKGGAKPKVPK